MRVYVFTHQVLAIDEQQHEDDHQGQQHAVQHLRQDDHADEFAVGNKQNSDGSAGDQQRVQPVEDRRVFESAIQTGLQAQPFANRVGRGKGQDGGGKQ